MRFGGSRERPGFGNTRSGCGGRAPSSVARSRGIFSPYRALRDEAMKYGKREPKTKSLQKIQELASGSNGEGPFC